MNTFLHSNAIITNLATTSSETKEDYNWAIITEMTKAWLRTGQ